MLHKTNRGPAGRAGGTARSRARRIPQDRMQVRNGHLRQAPAVHDQLHHNRLLTARIRRHLRATGQSHQLRPALTELVALPALTN